MTSSAPPLTTVADGPRYFRLSRDEIATRLAQPAVIPELHDKHVVSLSDAPTKLAAVLVPLVPRDTGLHVLLTQRTPHMNSHPSQISFPGGRVEGGDENRISTALREAEEEIGLARARVDIVGTLPDYDMPSGFRISPVVGWIEPPFDLTLDPVEVGSAFEVPLTFLFDPANHQRRSYHFNDKQRDYLAMPYQGHYIWGATAGMLYSLYRQLTADSGNR